jgi:hypothetical protein
MRAEDAGGVTINNRRYAVAQIRRAKALGYSYEACLRRLIQAT